MNLSRLLLLEGRRPMAASESEAQSEQTATPGFRN